MKKYAAPDTRTVKMPSCVLAQSLGLEYEGTLTRMKIHRHPFKPPTPLMCAMPYQELISQVPGEEFTGFETQASIPPNAPASEAALKKRDTR